MNGVEKSDFKENPKSNQDLDLRIVKNKRKNPLIPTGADRSENTFFSFTCSIFIDHISTTFVLLLHGMTADRQANFLSDQSVCLYTDRRNWTSGCQAQPHPKSNFWEYFQFSLLSSRQPIPTNQNFAKTNIILKRKVACLIRLNPLKLFNTYPAKATQFNLNRSVSYV